MSKKITGVSITTHVTDGASSVWTRHQLGGEGTVCNRPLIVVGHQQHQHSPITSLEYVSIAARGDEISSVGEHVQQTDEIYFLLSGRGQLCTNGHYDSVAAGDLVIAPRGVRHSLTNWEDQPLNFFVAEVQAPEVGRTPTIVHDLAERLAPIAFHLADPPLHGCALSLQPYFSGPWGDFFLLELPPGGRIFPYMDEHVDQNLLIPTGSAILSFPETGNAIHTGGFGLNAWIPRAVRCSIINRSDHDVLPFIILTLPRLTPAEVDHA